MSDPASAPRWVRSSYSYGNGECFELAVLPDGMIGVRDSKDPGGNVLRFTRGEVEAFVRGVVAGEFDSFR